MSIIKHLSPHPLADIFPLLTGAEFDALVEDVRANGVLEPIWICQGKILDGRNRYRAARAAGVHCPTQTYEGTDPLGFVVSLNLKRRHLSPSQLAFVALDIERIEAERAKERMKAGGGDKKSGVQQIAPPIEDTGKARDKAAEAVGVNRQYVSDAKKISKTDSAVAEMVCAGTINLHEGKKLIALPAEARRSAVQAVASGADVRTAVRAAKKIGYNARIEATKPKPLEGTYRIIYIDPPWKYHGLNQADEYGHAERHYDCLDDNQLCEFRPDGKRLVKELADDNSVLFMWVTAPMLERSFPIIKAWGFEYKTFFVWDKVKHNVGYYNSVRAELLLVCTRGSCTPDTGKLIDSVQSIERSNKHSQKPVEFYDIIEAMYDHGRKLEIFARSGRKGWDSVGNEMSGMTAIGRGPSAGAYMPFGKAKKKKSRPALAA